MKISLSWLGDYLKTTQTAEQLAETLTRSGIEVKSVVSHGAAIPKVVAAQILESTQHPNADRLSVCKVDDGSGTPRQIVCGAKNYKVGDKILLALPGAALPGDVKIKVGKLRGVESEGMMCSSKELGLGEGVDGLHILPPETMIGTELGALFPADDILELEITPNRPDWLGYLGVAREAAAFGAGEFLEPAWNLPSTIEDKNVATITDHNGCPFYSIRKIDGITMNPSPSWLVQRLAVMEARPINLVVDLANYVMFETAQPLHAFDANKIQGALNVRFAREGEKLEALDGKTYQLQSSDLVIADDQGPQALAGIIGGMKSGVTAATNSILLESAIFDPATIAHSLRYHGINTEAGYRFERGNRAGTMEASARVAALLDELTGSIAAKNLFVAGQFPEPLQIELRGDQVRQLLGAEMSDEQIDGYLKKLGLIKKESAWQISSWRPDLYRSVDLIEEVSRVHGIEAIKSRYMAFPAPSSKEDQAYDQMMMLRRRLAAGGFFEARTGTLVAKEIADKKAIALRNPMGEQQAVLRTSLLSGLKKVLQHNLQQGSSSIRLFELGKIYQQSEAPYCEEKFSLALMTTGAAVPMSWRSDSQRSLDLYDFKGMVDQLVPGKINYQSWEEPLPPGMSLMLRVFCDAHLAGYVGLLHPAAARELMLTGQEYPVAVAELDVAMLCDVIEQGGGNKVGVLTRFPAMVRDIALIVDKSVAYASLEQVLLSAKEELLRSVTPFDIFTDPSGEKIAADKKSVALSLKFQHDDRTLTAQEVGEACERLMMLLKTSFDAEVRS
ncbi:MAG: phenylalanine--tRNA ligase subunit beta [Chthoniobacterales bacterium]|nr:phenylalanine--tRNA ligase subunit beta [Chthoniobacterales bacterium]